MHDLDLIPHLYRKRVYLLQQLRWMSVSLLAVVFLSTVAAVSYAQGDTSLKFELAEMERLVSANNEKKASYKRLQDEHDVLSTQWSSLNTLRKGVILERVLLAIDESLKDRKVWLSRSHFNRVYKATKNTADDEKLGYFLVIPLPSKNGVKESYSLGSSMDVSGFAIDHSELSAFVTNMLLQKEIRDVRILRTNTRKQQATNVIEFDINVVISVSKSL